jgi:hypothetical protein
MIDSLTEDGCLLRYCAVQSGKNSPSYTNRPLSILRCPVYDVHMHLMDT